MMLDAKSKAEKVLKSIENYSIPISLSSIIKHEGITLVHSDLDDSVSGFFVIKNDKPFISINKNQSENRQRFTLAHELGHYFLHQKKMFIDRSNKSLFRNDKSSTGEERQEIQANTFAANLLMPEDLIKSELKKAPPKGDVIDYLASEFKVSSQAMSFRLSNLGYDFGLF